MEKRPCAAFSILAEIFDWLNPAEQYILQALQNRKAAGNLRALRTVEGLVDFCSNDYLGFARSKNLKQYAAEELAAFETANGSGGSRLLSGNTAYAEELEKYIARVHGFDAALLYNSGFDANVGLFSSLPQRGDTVIADELVHASIIDGVRISNANRYTFRHNDLASLNDKLKNAKGRVYVAVESIYSMDGDAAPLTGIAQLAQQYNASLIVDEAHATGVFGYGMVEQLGLQSQVFAKVVTFSKALGCHGATVLGSNSLREYLINFSRSFVYTTAAPLHQLATVKAGYHLLKEATAAVAALRQNIGLFKSGIGPEIKLIPSDSAIQSILIGNNQGAGKLADMLETNNLDVRPILSPTVPAGTERLRISLHSFNTPREISTLTNIINNATL